MNVATPKVCVVTGAGSGLGRSLSRRAAQDGWAIAALDIDLEDAQAVAAGIVSTGGRARGFRCDVAQETDASAAALAVAEEFGDLGVLWINAGVAYTGGLAEDDPRTFDWMYAVNVLGAIHTLRAFLPSLLRSAGRRHLGFMSSTAGLTASSTSTPGYAATKHALIGLAESARAELAPMGVEVTIACPGVVNTQIWNGARRRQEQFGGPRSLPKTFGERHRKTGLDPDWVIGRVWTTMLDGGGYVAPIPDGAPAAAFAARAREIEASFTTP